MTISTTHTNNSFTGNGSQTVYSFTFAVAFTDPPDTTHIRVKLNGVVQATSMYTVVINSSFIGGTVTFNTAPANNVAILIERNTPKTQDLALAIESKLPSPALERAVDKTVLISQEINTSISTVAFPAPESIKLLRWNTAATALENVSANQALSDAGGLGGNVVGPSPAVSTAHSMVLWNDALGRTVKNGPALGNSREVFTSNGAGTPGSFQRLGVDQIFGDNTNWRAAPTTGTLTGTYRTTAAWTTTGLITANRCRLFFGSTVTINHNITVGSGQEGNAGGQPNGFATAAAGIPQNGQGRGGGGGASRDGASAPGGGGGGGHGGAGGRGGGVATGAAGQGGLAYNIMNEIAGSGGGGGHFLSTAGGTGGVGGGGFYVEAVGAIIVNANITADGAVGGNGTAGNDGGGGGGSGGAIDLRSLATITLAVTSTISAQGGAGGNAGSGTGGAGGGGGGGIVNVAAVGAVTNNATINVSGGAAGATGLAAIAGSAGVSSIGVAFEGPRGCLC